MVSLIKSTPFILIIALILLSATQARRMIAKKIVHAINVGSNVPKRSSEGFVYAKDQGYEGETNIVDYGNDPILQNQVIKYAKEPSLFLTERQGKSTFSYLLSLEKEGTFSLILKFCEMKYDSAGKRLFNVKLGDQIVLKDFDIFSKSGQFVAHDEYIEFRNKNVCNNALVDGKLKITFEKTETDNPVLSGLIIYSGGLEQTDYEDVRNYKLSWDRDYRIEQRKKQQEQEKLLEEKLKKQEKIVISDDHESVESGFEDIELKKNQQKQEGRQAPPLKEMLMSPLGIVCMVGFFFSMFVLVSSGIDDFKQHQKEA